MISKDSCLHLGTISKPYGTKGSLILASKFQTSKDYIKGESLFLEIEGILVPFFIENIQERSAESLILKLKEIHTENKVKEFSGVEVYILKDHIELQKLPRQNNISVAGYRVIDVNKGFTGLAGEIDDIEQNPLLHVISGESDFLVPFHNDIILSIDHKLKEINIDAPEGLFGL